MGGKRAKPQSPQFVTMTDAEFVRRFREAAEAYTARITRSKQAARKALIAEGIITKGGRLTKRYR